MSVVAAKVYGDRISIAADSILCYGWSKRIDSKFQKLEKVNDMIIGSVGSAQECSLMIHYCTNHKPISNEERDVLAFIIEFGQWKSERSDSSTIENSYIIAYGGKCFHIDGLWVHEISNYAAIGAGEDFANSAMYLGHSPTEAVKAACDLCCFVAEPIVEYEVKS